MAPNVVRFENLCCFMMTLTYISLLASIFKLPFEKRESGEGFQKLWNSAIIGSQEEALYGSSFEAKQCCSHINYRQLQILRFPVIILNITSLWRPTRGFSYPRINVSIFKFRNASLVYFLVVSSKIFLIYQRVAKMGIFILLV